MTFLGRRISVLVAEDNRDLARVWLLLLRFAGFEVEAVHDGAEAVRTARARRPDVLLLDIGLPGMDGFQVAEHLRADEALKGLLIIAVSGYAPEMYRSRVRPGHFDHHLIKPVDLKTLLPLIRKVG